MSPSRLLLPGPPEPADSQWRKRIGKILQKAYNEERLTLYEHEVYKILEILEIPVPPYSLIQKESEITRELLAGFGSPRVVLKIVSSGITHKGERGGVKILHKDLDFIRYSWLEMTGKIRREGYPVHGALLTEWVDYSPELGNELLIGLKESDTFGPVISFSKGGADAEHFAAHFSPPNLILPPLSSEWARALLASTVIQKKYLHEGKDDYIAGILKVILRFSLLSTAFSEFFPASGGFSLKELEINPFVFNRDRKLIALDGFASFIPRREDRSLPEPDRKSRRYRNLEAFFSPKGIAVVGVSTSDPEKPGNIIASNLLKLNREDVRCINPRGGTTVLEGKEFPLYPSLKALPEPVDLIIVTVPAAAAGEVVKEAIALPCRGILLIPGGFSETSHDRGPEEEILRLCREKDIRIMGPNCLGVIYAGDGGQDKGINTFFIPETKFHPDLSQERNMALFSQSGALGLVELSELRHAVSPKVVVSYGNQLDVDPCDLIRYWGNDPDIRVIGLYMEGLKPGAGRRLFNIGSRGLAGKCRAPIVVYKAGRTREGQKATQSHTARMAGEYAVAKAAMKQAGLIVAQTMAEHLGYIKTFAMLHDRKVTGKRVAVITNAGYEKANAADNLKDMELAELDEKTSEELKKILPPFVTVESLLDLTPMVGDRVFVQAADLLLASDQVDALLISIVPHSGAIHTTDEEISNYPDHIAKGIVKLAVRYDKPFVVSLTATSGPDSSYNRMGKILECGGVPVYLSAEEGMLFLSEYIRYYLIRRQNRLEEWIK